jgi:hypothetical protein
MSVKKLSAVMFVTLFGVVQGAYSQGAKILQAEVTSDNNGNGQPNAVVIYYDDVGGTQTFANGQLTPPSAVEFRWPSACGDAVRVSGANLTQVDGSTIRAAFNPADFPSYYTEFIGTSRDLPAAFDPDNVSESNISLAEEVGPLISGDMAANAACSWPVSSAPFRHPGLMPKR